MKFLRQIKSEAKNIFGSKFILIAAILLIAFSIVSSVLTAINSGTTYYSGGGGGPIVYQAASYAKMSGDYYPGYYEGQEPIEVDGVIIEPENPFYWNVSDIKNQMDYLQTDSSMFTSPEVLDLVLDIMDQELSYYARFAAVVTTSPDYRSDLAWNGVSSIYDVFVYSHVDTENADILYEAYSYRTYMEREAFDAKYINVSATDRLAAIDAAQTKLDTLFGIVENGDFTGYINLMIQQQNDSIANFEAQIDMYEETLREHPEQEESLNASIEDCKKQIAIIENSTIPWLQYRLENNVIPYVDIWQNRAIDDITNNAYQLEYFDQYVMSEEQFNQDQWTKSQYGSYQNYMDAMNKQKAELQNTISIAEDCLDAGKPDMKYVTDGARYNTVSFLDYSVIVAMFAILLGGWLLASEFQFGTIRLLMIRPRTRTKILMSKFLAALLISLALYIVCAVLNIVMNGILLGFGDFGNPNFTIAGQMGFFAFYLPKFIACMLTIIFAFCISFMLSVLTKNIAISIAAPIVAYVGCYIAMAVMAYSGARWLAWTPIPYVQLSSFFIDNSMVKYMLQNGVPLSLTYGMIMMGVLSVVCVVVSLLAFRKRDITN